MSKKVFTFLPRLSRLLSMLAFAGLVSGCPIRSDVQPDGGPKEPANYEISPNLQPQSQTWGDAPDGRPRVLGAVRGPTGGATDFVVDEVVLVGIQPSALQEFVNRTGGKIIGGDQPLPPPPTGNPIAIDPALKTYTVRVDLSKVSLDNFDSDLSFGMQASGKYLISSVDAAKLLALVAREKTAGLPIAPNLVFYGDAGRFITASSEDPRWGAVVDTADAFRWVENSNTGSKTEMSRAWQFIESRETRIPDSRRSKIAIIDGGFHLDTAGHPRHCASATAPCDLPWTPLQYDMPRRSSIANRTSDARCSGGSPCPWHGLSSALAAVGTLDNAVGGAGSGSQTSIPILIASDLTAGSVNESLQLAVSWGAQVISMSFSATCDNVFCEAYFDLSGVNGTINDATRRGIVLLAAAGNANFDVDATKVFPCAFGDVICVGATAPGTQDRVSYSNWGRTRVDLWAPTNIHALMPDGTDPNLVNLDYASGTSSATPFAAGVVGMMKQVNPSLSVADTLRILQTAAWKDSRDPLVTYSLNAYAAVFAAANSSLPADVYEPNDSQVAARTLTLGADTMLTEYGFLTIGSPTDADFFRFNNPRFGQFTVELDSIPDLTGFMRLGIWLGDGTFPTGCAVSSTGTRINTYRVVCNWVPPGTVYLRVSADRPSGYVLRMRRVDRGSIGPDSFEVNQTLATAAGVTGSGPHAATFHVQTDADFYQVAAPSGTSSIFTYDFEMSGLNAPYYRLFGYAPGSTTAVAATTPNRLQMTSPGAWRIQVMPRLDITGVPSAPYQFQLVRRYAGPAIDPSKFTPTPQNGFRWLDPNVDTGAIAGRLPGDAEYFGFQNVGKFKAIDFWGTDLEVDLLDTQGILIGMSQPQSNPQLPDALRLTLPTNLTTNGFYVVRVRRPTRVDPQLELNFWVQLSSQ